MKLCVLLGPICIAESVLDKPLSLLLKPRDTDDVSHVRLKNVKFVALTFFVTKKLATLA